MSKLCGEGFKVAPYRSSTKALPLMIWAHHVSIGYIVIYYRRRLWGVVQSRTGGKYLIRMWGLHEGLAFGLVFLTCVLAASKS